MNFKLFFMFTFMILIYETASEIYKEPDASNCIEIGRGIVPIYEKCSGCKVENAHNCVNDMRKNKAGNVPPGCEMETLTGSTAGTEKKTNACCPKFVHDDDATTINSTTAAYPDAFLCLELAGCSDSNTYLDLLYECEELCAGQYLDSIGTDYACAPTENPSSRITISYLSLVVVLAVVSMTILDLTT